MMSKVTRIHISFCLVGWINLPVCDNQVEITLLNVKLTLGICDSLENFAENRNIFPLENYILNDPNYTMLKI